MHSKRSDGFAPTSTIGIVCIGMVAGLVAMSAVRTADDPPVTHARDMRHDAGATLTSPISIDSVSEAGVPDVEDVVDASDVLVPSRARHYWCTDFTRISRRGWQGFDALLHDGSHQQYIVVPGTGIVRVAPGEVPGVAAPGADFSFRTERTSWGWDGGVGHVGQRVTLAYGTEGEERMCYEFRGGELHPCGEFDAAR